MQARDRQRGREEPTAKNQGPHSPARAAVAAVGAPMTPGSILALQRSVGNSTVSRALAEEREGAGSGPAAARDLLGTALASPGRPLAGPLRTELESYYQADFSAARIHDNPVAQRATEALGAQAMTVGTHVFLGAGASTRKDIIGHEFGHVSENLKGVAETGRDNGAGVTVTDPAQRSERAAEADGTAFAAGARTAPSVTAQRAVAPDQDQPGHEPH